MTDDDDFSRRLADLRPKLHRYCARMTGSTTDGEDVVQEVLLKALGARARGDSIDNVDAWLFRVAHNASLDLLRARARDKTVHLTDDLPIAAEPSSLPDAASVGFRTFLELPVLQRCAVVLKDVLGHTIEEIAEVADCSVPAAKSALQRGRARLREVAARRDEDLRLPLLADDERRRLTTYIALFQAGDFDAIRGMLSDEVRLDLVNRLQLQGRERVSPYFARYGEAAHWRYAFGAVEGHAAMLVYDSTRSMARPAHFVLLDWKAGAIDEIRDFLFAPYVMDGVDWVRLE